jgi:hypothetical protein
MYKAGLIGWIFYKLFHRLARAFYLGLAKGDAGSPQRIAWSGFDAPACAWVITEFQITHSGKRILPPTLILKNPKMLIPPPVYPPNFALSIN